MAIVEPDYLSCTQIECAPKWTDIYPANVKKLFQKRSENDKTVPHTIAEEIATYDVGFVNQI